MRKIQGRGIMATVVVGLLGGGGAERPAERQPDAAMRIVINTSARKLYVYENGERTRTYPVAVGQSGHRTPHGSFSISRVVWNPWWHPPARKWAADEKVTPPGPSNPMGRVKMYFRNLYFIHGTPHEGSLGRAASHGCVRMSNGDAIALARLVHEYGGGAPNSTIDNLVSSPKKTRTIWLKRKIPVEIVAKSAAVHDGRLELYARNSGAAAEVVREDAMAALQEAGFDLAKLDRDRLRDLVELSRRSPVSAPLEELEAAAPAEGPIRDW